MSDVTYHIKIKKEYASAILEDLQQIDAIEIMEEDGIPDWQKKESLKRLAAMNTNPSIAINEDDFFKQVEMDEDGKV